MWMRSDIVTVAVLMWLTDEADCMDCKLRSGWHWPAARARRGRGTGMWSSQDSASTLPKSRATTVSPTPERTWRRGVGPARG